MDDDRPEEAHPGEKGPPAWEERTGDRDAPMPDEPPDSSSEVGQVMGLPTGPAPEGEDADRDGQSAGDAGPAEERGTSDETDRR